MNLSNVHYDVGFTRSQSHTELGRNTLVNYKQFTWYTESAESGVVVSAATDECLIEDGIFRWTAGPVVKLTLSVPLTWLAIVL